MKIKVRGYLTFRNSIGKRLFYEDEREFFTLGDLLRKLSKEGFGGELEGMILDPETSRTRPHAAILINGNHYTHLATMCPSFLLWQVVNCRGLAGQGILW
jgi:hypothetical protein